MATYSATLYKPGQPALTLTATEVAALLITAGQYLIASPEQVERWLGVMDSEPLACHATAAVFGLFNADDYEGATNPEADPITLRLFGVAGMVGPLLLIEETTEQTAPRIVGGGTHNSEQVAAFVTHWVASNPARLAHLGTNTHAWSLRAVSAIIDRNVLMHSGLDVLLALSTAPVQLAA